MKRASYRDGVSIIALNDEALEMDAEVVAGQVSVCLLADLFGVSAEKVAKDVVKYRSKQGRKDGGKQDET